MFNVFEEDLDSGYFGMPVGGDVSFITNISKKIVSNIRKGIKTIQECGEGEFEIETITFLVNCMNKVVESLKNLDTNSAESLLAYVNSYLHWNDFVCFNAMEIEKYIKQIEITYDNRWRLSR